ncbi:CPBP family intramembrane metalloprotease [Glycomyces sp. TRM65418]|uniref:CPBP family intramembrane glutamic endopeptidase n=1 Tax=Glycomyces sp. TRM65418 TaxID=2867006 RepID=UPI001CE6B192|nr:CPBP family intramembrane glutamic endopeptidase [Glycomyces sp. TRM65418]MCC3763869.1 CPBP family intramembrane metalloprotease [Glycomyces sp. TRM65418]QZD53572.1 CPBP family intramembrane metalloprotease [Glycomyces sp. TRM65418]
MTNRPDAVLADDPEASAARLLSPRTIRREIWIVLAVSLGASAVWSIVSIVGTLTEPGGLADSVQSMNSARAEPERPWYDLAQQLVSLALAMAPVALALHFLSLDQRDPFRRIGLDARRPGFDLLGGAALAACIGVPGLGLYLTARALGLNAAIAAANLNDVWWAVPILVLAALKAAILEEVIGVGYLVTRLRQLAWRPAAIVGAHALLRGTYHLYQGFGGFVGNAVMGAVFALCFLRWKRTGPLVVAHTLLDIAAFVGYLVVAPRVSWL